MAESMMLERIAVVMMTLSFLAELVIILAAALVTTEDTHG
jgi:hypothetical protein